MSIPIDKQLAFFDWQVKEHENSFLAYLSASMNQLFKSRKAFIGRIWGLDQKRGIMLLRFKKGLSPRLKYPLGGFLITTGIDPSQHNRWDFSYKYFRENYVYERTDLQPVYYLKNSDPDWSICGCFGVEISFLDNIRSILDSGNKPAIVLAEKDPPIQYLLNLRDFIKKFPDDPILNLDLSKKIESWEPEEVSSNQNVKTIIYSSLKNSNQVIIQGPPGTGKSYLIAEIVSNFLEEGKKVCIASLTNKALIEIAEQPALEEAINKYPIYKTNLSVDEKVLVPGLISAKSLEIGNGELLLSTYYKLSDWFNPNLSNSQKKISPIYDLVVIEEASQTFLTTIAAFVRLGVKSLIVGDPLQLQPIILNEPECTKIHQWMLRYAYGLAGYVSNSDNKGFILTDTYRLSTRAAQLTGTFYQNRLKSVQMDHRKLKLSDSYGTYLPSDGGSIILDVPLIEDGDRPLYAIKLACEFVFDLLQNNPLAEFALLSPFKNTVMALQDYMEDLTGDFSRLTIDTIDRIQGLTVDFTILIFPLNNPTFAFQINRFNVATSRAKSGTLIITDKGFSFFSGLNPFVIKYLNSLNVTKLI